jgi:putative lumazine-binding protein
MKKIISLATLLITIHSYAQDEKQNITNAVMDYVDAFYFGDTTKILRSISPAVVKYGYYRKKDATVYEGEPMSYREMLDYAASVKKRNNPNADKLEKKIEILDYQDQTAAAKLYAWWGTDYILLAKLDGKWMITHVLWQSPPKPKG